MVAKLKGIDGWLLLWNLDKLKVFLEPSLDSVHLFDMPIKSLACFLDSQLIIVKLLFIRYVYRLQK